MWSIIYAPITSATFNSHVSWNNIFLMRYLWSSVATAFVCALTGGVAEYVMTGGTSTWVPLVAGLIGAVPVLIVGIFGLRRRKEPLYTSRTASELTEAVEGKTSVEADIISQPHMGFRLKVNGIIIDIDSRLFFPGYTVDLQPGENKDISIYAEFGRRWSPRLRTLRVGDYLGIDGKIWSINRWSVSVDDCRIIGMGPQWDKTENLC